MNDPNDRPEEILTDERKEGEPSDERANDEPGAPLEQVETEADGSVCQTAPTACNGGGETLETAPTSGGEDPQVLGVSDHSDEDPHSDPAEDERAKLLELRGELNRLEQQIAEREATYRRLERECAEFRELYPETPLSALPDRVWEAVQAGVPIAAAFALSERKRMLLEAEADRKNRENKKVAPEGLFGSEEIYYSPAEVRAMTPEQVRKNYDKIIQSMEKWY